MGKEKSHLLFVKKLLRKKINAQYFKKPNATTVVKKRYIDEVSKNKLLGAYLIDEQKLDRQNEKKLIKSIKNKSNS